MAATTIRLFGDPVLKQRAAEVTDIDGASSASPTTCRHHVRGARRSAWPPPRSACRSASSSTTSDDGRPGRSSTPSITEAAASGSTRRAACRCPASTSRSCGPKEIHLTGYDLDGNEVSIEADELLARVFQHELDHLDGVLLLERLDADQRKRGDAGAAPTGDRAGRAGAASEPDQPELTCPSRPPGLDASSTSARPRRAVPPLRGAASTPASTSRWSSRRPTSDAGAGACADAEPGEGGRDELGLPVSHPRRRRRSTPAPTSAWWWPSAGSSSRPCSSALPMVNLHFSLLPRWRGAAPVERAILAGDTADRRVPHGGRGGPRHRPRLRT